MCACKPGATCSYHLYRTWPQERKDAWNAQRRESYKANRGGRSDTHESLAADPNKSAIPNLNNLMGVHSNAQPASEAPKSASPISSSLASLMGGDETATPLIGGDHVTDWSDPLSNEAQESVRVTAEREYARGQESFGNLSNDEQNAIRLFKSSEFEAVNAGRGYSDEREALKSAIAKLEDGNEPRTLYRGEAPAYGVSSEELSARFEVGGTVSWGDRFCSTTTDPRIGVAFANTSASEGVLLQFKDTRRGGSLASEGDSHAKEAESLISGASKFRVMSKSREVVGGVSRLVIVLEDE